MIIGIDVKELAKGRAGISVYIRSMLDWFHKLDDGKNEYILFSGKDFDIEPTWKRCKKVIYKIHTTGSFEVAYCLNKIIEKYHVDLFWGPEHCIPLRKGNFKKVVTIHDIAVILHPEWGTFYNSMLQKYMVRRSIESADKVIAISNSTKSDLVSRFKFDNDLIQVIYNGDSPYHYSLRKFNDNFEKDLRVKYHITDKFFLYCGTIEPRKNIINLVKGFELFAERNSSCYKLVLAGGLGWKFKPILEYIKRSPFYDRIVLAGYVSDEEKEFLYRNATALVFPSYYEGLGLPVIEAMSVGTLVITANNSSLKEVGGDVAFFIDDVDNYAQIDEKMTVVVNLSKEEKEIRRVKSIEHSKKFSRRKCAEQLLECFRTCCSISL